MWTKGDTVTPKSDYSATPKSDYGVTAGWKPKKENAKNRQQGERQKTGNNHTPATRKDNNKRVSQNQKLAQSINTCKTNQQD